MGSEGEVILLVDDDEDLLRATVEVLRRRGYSPIAALGPHEALKKSRDFRGEIHLLLTDVSMPEMDGLELAQQVLAERARIRVLLMSAYGAFSRLPLVKKPFRMGQLLEQVAHVIAGPPSVIDVFIDKEAARGSMRDALTAEADEARFRYLLAQREFMEIIKELPSGIPNPDGAMRIELSADRMKQAFEEYQKTLRRLDDHVAASSRIDTREKE
jgi:CheY-like chemotaxis protein